MLKSACFKLYILENAWISEDFLWVNEYLTIYMFSPKWFLKDLINFILVSHIFHLLAVIVAFRGQIHFFTDTQLTVQRQLTRSSTHIQ